MKRKIYKFLLSAKHQLFALTLIVFSGTAYSQTYTLNYTGSVQTLNLSAGTFDIQAWGGDGYTQTAGYNGRGGYSNGILTLNSAQTIYIYVGGVGGYPSISVTPNAWTFNGGGIGYPAVNASYGNGGGASDVRTVGGLWDNPASLASRVIVAGGGGAGRNSSYIGGNGGGVTGGTGTYFTPDQVGGPTGGSQTAGGTNTGYTSGLTLATLGKAMTWDGNTLSAAFLAGGGGGYYGGGSGRVAGGGGSSYIGGVSSATTIMFGQTGFVPNPVITGDGRVVITALCNISLTNASTTGPGPICAGNSATIATNAISNYVWSNASTSSSIVVSPTVTTSYSLTATSPSNCTASSVITITVQSGNPTVTAVTSNTAVCAGQPIILTGGGANTYTWTGGATNAVSYTPTATGGYTVTGANACGIGTAAVNVTVNTSPVVFGGVNSPTVCNGTAVTFTSGGNATTYSWSNGVINNVPFVPSATNDYTLTGTANGCSSISVVSVTVFITPTITPVATPTAICVGQTAILSSQGASGYTWTPGTNLFASTATVSPGISTTYTLVRTNGLCSSVTTLNLVVNPLPLVNASATPSQICTGAAINLVVIGPITNTWSPGGFTQSNFNVYPNFSTSYTVTGSNGSCTAQAIIPIVVKPSPVISINSVTNTICQGNSSTLTVSGTGPLTYTWSPSGNNGGTEIVSPNGSTIISVSATNTLNCISSLSQLILVNPLPDMSVNATPSFICSGDPSVLSLTQATASTNNNVAYIWNTSGTSPNITVSPTVTTTYYVAGTNTITGCQNSNSVTLSVYISTFSISSPTAICKGETATLTAAGQPTSYVWTVVSGNNTAPSVTVSPVINTTYSVTGINGSCNTTSQVAVIVNPIPNVTALVAKGQICKFEISTITGSGANTYSWSTGASTPVLSFTLSVTTNYTLTGTDLNGCAKTVTVSQFVATCLGIEDTKGNANIGLNVYPNPNNGNFIITSDANITLNVINSLGQVISTMKLSEENKKEITVSTLPNGIYFITGEANGQKVTKKIIVEK